MSRYGRYAVAEPISSLLFRRHRYTGGALRTVEHEPPIPVLNQEGLLSQGIRVSQIVPGARDVNALGSCVFNAGVAHLAERLRPDKAAAFGITGSAVHDEELAIGLYHEVTTRTGDTATEWPPTDCGSNSLHLCTELERGGQISGWKTAQGADDVVSLMQGGSVITGQPFFYSWEDPDASGFIDGAGTVADLERAIASGVAGGHETVWTAIEQIGFTATGAVDPQRTIIRFLNSWGSGWGELGSGLLHLLTYVMLAGHCDFRQVTP